MRTAADQGPRGRGSWALLVIALLTAPLNAFVILFWAWAATHHATDTSREDAVTVAAFVVLGLIQVATVTAFARRWKRALAALTLLQVVPALYALSLVVVGV